MIKSPDLDNQSFEQIFDEMLAKMMQYYKGYADFSYQDPGVTLLELFCLLKEMQHYYINYIGDKHYLKYLKLLSINKENIKYSRTYLKFDITGESSCCVLPAEFAVFNGEICFETETPLLVSKNKIKKLLLEESGIFTDFTQLNDDYDRAFHFFGYPSCRGNKLYIGFNEDLSVNPIEGLFFNLKEESEIFKNFTPLGKISLEYLTEVSGWKKLSFTDETNCFTKRGYIRFCINHKMLRTGIVTGEPHYWLRLVLEEDNFEISPSVLSIMTNIAFAVQKQTFRGEDAVRVIGSSDGTPNQRFNFSEEGLDPQSLRLQIDMQDWELTESLDGSQSCDKHFLYEDETIVFGNGLNGAIPEKGKDNIRIVSYVKTLGGNGNIKKGVFKSDKVDFLKIQSLINSYGGRDAQTVEEVLGLINLKKIYKAVTCDDYIKLLLEMPFVLLDDVSVIVDINKVTIIAKPVSDKTLPGLNPAYISNISAYLEPYRIITTEVKIIPPEYYGLTVYIEVETLNSALNPKYVIENCIKEMYPGIEHTRRMGRVNFGKTVSYGVFYGAIANLACVHRVKNIFFECGGRTVQNSDISIPENGIVYLKEIKLTEY